MVVLGAENWGGAFCCVVFSVDSAGMAPGEEAGADGGANLFAMALAFAFWVTI
jgi:hypothetical protein